jgi:hypothetical protein
MLLMQPSLSKFNKITPCSRATKLVNFQIISTLSNEFGFKGLIGFLHLKARLSPRQRQEAEEKELRANTASETPQGGET